MFAKVFLYIYNINFTRQITVKKAKVTNKTRLNIQFKETLSMNAALDMYWLSAL